MTKALPSVLARQAAGMVLLFVDWRLVANGLPDQNAFMETRPSGDADDAEHTALLQAIALRKDRDAFKALFAIFAPRVAAFARRLGADRQHAEDIAQEVMLSVWRRAGSYDPEKAGVSTWIYAIARNRRIDVIRKERRPEFDPEDPAFVPTGEPKPDDALDAAQRHREVHEALSALPAMQAQILRLAFIEDKTHVDIADELGVPLGTVKSRIRLAMSKLRIRLKDDP